MNWKDNLLLINMLSYWEKEKPSVTQTVLEVHVCIAVRETNCS